MADVSIVPIDLSGISDRAEAEQQRREEIAEATTHKGKTIVDTTEVLHIDGVAIIETLTVDEIGASVFDVLVNKSVRQQFPELYNRSSGISRIVGDKGRKHIEIVDTDILSGIIADNVVFRKLSMRKGGVVSEILMSPPRQVVTYVLRNCDKTLLPSLDGIIAHPILTRNNEGDVVINSQEGYDSHSKLYIDCEVNYQPVDNISEIIDDFYGDFPYKSDAGLAATLSVALTHIIKPILGKSTRPPLFVTNASTNGAGKSYNTDVTYAGLLGRIAGSINFENKTPIELGKLLYAEALAGKTYANLDNADTAIGSALATYTSQPYITDRILGFSRTAEIPNTLVISINGRSIETSTEIADRGVSIDLHTEEPSSQREFKHPELEDYIIENRDVYLSALLTMCEAWIEAGCPKSSHKSRMAVWARHIGGILQTSQPTLAEAFLSDADDFRRASDQRYMDFCEALRAIVDGAEYDVNITIQSEDGNYISQQSVFVDGPGLDTEFSTSDVFQLLSYTNAYRGEDGYVNESGANLLGQHMEYSGNHETRRKSVLTQLLRSESNRPFGKYKIIDCGTQRKLRMFKVAEV